MKPSFFIFFLSAANPEGEFAEFSAAEFAFECETNNIFSVFADADNIILMLSYRVSVFN